MEIKTYLGHTFEDIGNGCLRIRTNDGRIFEMDKDGVMSFDLSYVKRVGVGHIEVLENYSVEAVDGTVIHEISWKDGASAGLKFSSAGGLIAFKMEGANYGLSKEGTLTLRPNEDSK